MILNKGCSLVANKMSDYQLTVSAEHDLEGILEFGLDTFGEEVAIDYYEKIVSQFINIAENPLQYPSREEIRENYRLCSFGSHDIYFQVRKNEVLIVRILNKQNIEAAILRALK